MNNTAYFWFTGLSGAGKTTVAEGVRVQLQEEGYSVVVLDGDDVRERFHCHLTFSREDILKNNTLIAKMCEEIKGKADVVFVPIISPFRESRRDAREGLGSCFYEIYFKAGLDYVMKQDVKGLYEKARNNLITDLIGYSSDGVSYEVPENPDFVIHTEKDSPEQSISDLYGYVRSKLEKKIEISE